MNSYEEEVARTEQLASVAVEEFRQAEARRKEAEAALAAEYEAKMEAAAEVTYAAALRLADAYNMASDARVQAALFRSTASTSSAAMARLGMPPSAAGLQRLAPVAAPRDAALRRKTKAPLAAAAKKAGSAVKALGARLKRALTGQPTPPEPPAPAPARLDWASARGGRPGAALRHGAAGAVERDLPCGGSGRRRPAGGGGGSACVFSSGEPRHIRRDARGNAAAPGRPEARSAAAGCARAGAPAAGAKPAGGRALEWLQEIGGSGALLRRLSSGQGKLRWQAADMLGLLVRAGIIVGHATDWLPQLQAMLLRQVGSAGAEAAADALLALAAGGDGTRGEMRGCRELILALWTLKTRTAPDLAAKAAAVLAALGY
jgi:hypothetical protein